MSAQIDGQPAAAESTPAGPRVVIWLSVLLVAIMLLSFAVWQFARTGTEPSSLSRAFGLDIGNFPAISEQRFEPAPALEGPRLGGGWLSLTNYEGEILVVNIWASWCGPCRREQPELELVWREYRARDVQFLGVNIRDQQAAARAFQREFDVTYPSFFDETSKLAADLNAQVLPSTFVIDRGRRIVFRLSGTVDATLLRSVLDATLDVETPRG